MLPDRVATSDSSVLDDLDPAAEADAGCDPLQDLAHAGGQLGLGVARLGDRAGLDRGNDARGRVADAEQAALTFGDDLELNGGLVELRMELLELAKRRPLRLADGLARGLDAQGVLAHRLRPFLLALHAPRRPEGWAGLASGLGLRDRAPPPSAACGTSA